MIDHLNSQDIERLANYILRDYHPSNEEQAFRLLKSRLGPYNPEGSIFRQAVQAYFRQPVMV